MQILRKSQFLYAKIRGVNSVSGEKLHDFEIICSASGVQSHPSPHTPTLRMGLLSGPLYYTMQAARECSEKIKQIRTSKKIAVIFVKFKKCGFHIE